MRRELDKVELSPDRWALHSRATTDLAWKSCELRQRCECPDYEQAAGADAQAESTRGTMLLLTNRLAPCCLTDVSVKPQLVTPITTLGVEALPGVVPVNPGRTPKLASSGPPLEPPHMSEP